MIQRFIFAMMGSVLLGFTALSAQAVTILRDPDIEVGLRELARPVLTAAGLNPANVKILVVDNDRLNAFIIDHNHIFLHSGLIFKLQSAEQVQAVIAHEAAHIANGHIGRRINAINNAKTATTFGMLVAVAAAAGGEGAAAGALAAGAAGSAQGVYRGHSRSEESAADQSALAYLRTAGINTVAMVEVLEIFRGQEALSVGRQDPWVRTHPLTRDRLRAARAAGAGQNSVAANKVNAYWFARIQGKLSAFKRAPSWTLRRATGTGDVALMRRAVAYHRQGQTAKAKEAITTLVNRRPQDPYFRELQGQIFLESRDIDGAVRAYRAAASLTPRNALIWGGLGRALLAQNTAPSNTEALKTLQNAYGRDRRSARILRDLGTAYARAGQQGQAILAAAEAAMLRGDARTATAQAKRASGLLPRGSASWQRAQDLMP
ncbi:MAG: M48 family metalloprotease [Pseudomonadota bacterium]